MRKCDSALKQCNFAAKPRANLVGTLKLLIKKLDGELFPLKLAYGNFKIGKGK